MAGNSFSIDTSPVGNWQVTLPASAAGNAQIVWQPQVTVPMPLEAINALFAKAYTNPETSQLFGNVNPINNLVWVTRDFFQSGPGGITSATVSDDVLGFFSLILSYAKAATKQLTSIMPRTEFVT